MRLGFSDVDMVRHVRAASYEQKHESSWDEYHGVLQTTIGYGFALKDSECDSLTLSPQIGAQYIGLYRPGFSESGNGSALTLDAQYYDSLPLSLGLQLDYQHEAFTDGFGAGNTMLAPTLLQLSLTSELYYDCLNRDSGAAAFRGAGGYSFAGVSPDNDRSGLRLSGSFNVHTSSGFSMQLTLGGEAGFDHTKSLFGQLQAGYAF